MDVLTFLIVAGFVLFIVLKLKDNSETKSIAQPQRNTQRRTSKLPSEKRVYDTVRFKYRDADGGISERTVDLTMGKKGDQFRGYCHLRKDTRTFYFKRIQDFEVIDVATGEVSTPMEWRYKLQGTKVAKDALIEEKRIIAASKKLEEASDSWLSLTVPAPKVEFENKRFALAGYFSSGNREDSEGKVESKGGVIQQSPNGKTDYIVINPSQGVNKTFEKAILKLIERGIQPVIISEKHWLASLKNI